MSKWIYIATVLDPRNKLDKCFTAGDAMTPTEVKALYMAELLNVARHHAPHMLATRDPPPRTAAPPPRPATSTTARGALDLYSDSSDDDENVPLAHQVRAQQQRFDPRSLTAKESDFFFEKHREKQGKTYRKDKNFNVMEFFDEHKEALYLHRLLDTRTRSAKVDERRAASATSACLVGSSGHCARAWPPVLVSRWCQFR